MWPFRKKRQQVIWTERQIELYERQMAAREALGEKYICHRVNDVERLQSIKFQGVDFIFDGPKLPKLRRVK